MASAGALDAALAALHAPIEARAAQEEAADGALVYSVCPEQLVKDIEQSIVVEKPEAATIQARLFACARPRDVCAFLEATQSDASVERARTALLKLLAAAIRDHGCGRYGARAFATLKAVLEAPNGAAVRAHAAAALRALAKRGEGPEDEAWRGLCDARYKELRQAKKSAPGAKDTGRTCAAELVKLVARCVADRVDAAPPLDPASMDPVAPWRELGEKVLALAIAQLEKSKNDRRIDAAACFAAADRLATTRAFRDRAASAGGLAAKALEDYATDASAKQFADPAKALRLLRRRAAVVAPSARGPAGAAALFDLLWRVATVHPSASSKTPPPEKVAKHAAAALEAVLVALAADAGEDWAPVVAALETSAAGAARALGPGGWRANLTSDVFAAATIAAFLVPQGMSYALVSGGWEEGTEFLPKHFDSVLL